MKRLSLLLLLSSLLFSYPFTAAGVASQTKQGQQLPKDSPIANVTAPLPPAPDTTQSRGEARTKAEEVRHGDVGMTVLQTESVIAPYKKSIADLESELLKAGQEAIKAVNTKEALTAQQAPGLDVALASQLEETAKERVQLLRKKLQVFRRILVAEEELQKARDSTATLEERKSKLVEEVMSTPLEKAAMAPKEVAVAEAYLLAANAQLKEKESYLPGLKAKFKDVQKEAEEERERLQKDLKTLEELPFKKEEGTQRFVNQSKFLLQALLANTSEKLAIAEESIKLEEKELEGAKIDSFNAQLQVALLKERTALLGEGPKAEELQKKEEEAELAQRDEEEKKKTAEVERAAAQREKEEALKRAEELTQQQLAAVSPERKRVLELESLIFTIQGEIAKRKDDIITEGTRHYDDNAEYKKLAREARTILSGERLPSEIKEEIPQLKNEMARWEEKLRTVDSLLDAARKEKTLFTEQLQQARSELAAPPGESSKIVKESQTFKDTTLASKLVTHSQERLKLLEEEERLITAWIARIEERRGIIQEGLNLLAEAMKELSKLRESNIWARREWTTSWSAMRGGMAKLPKRGSDIITFIENPSQRKVRISLAGVLTLALITATILGWHYCKKWCQLNLKRLEEGGPGVYVKVSLLPAVFRVLQGGVTLWLVLGLCFGITALFDIKGPLIHSLKYGLIVFSIYKVLHGFLVEAVRPRGWGKPLLALPPSLAEHSYLTLHVILLYSAIFITIIGVLGSFVPRLQEILWRVYSLSALALFIWFVAPKHVFLTLLSSPSTESGATTKTALRKFQRGCIHTAHPLAIAFLAFLIVLNSLGYISMTYALIGTIISCVITIVSVAVARKLVTTFILDRLARKKPVEQRATAFRVTRGIVDYSSVIVSIIVVLSLWLATLIDFASKPSAPGPFKSFASEVGHILKITAGVLGYRLGLGEGGYTTPFKIMIGLALVATSFLVAAGIKRLLQRRLLTKLKLGRGIEATISSIITYVIITFSILFAMSVAGVPLRSLAFFAGALGIGIGFGLQNIIQNFVSGIILLFERPVRVGDIVELGGGIGGTVEKIGPRSTTIITADNIAVVVPNSKLIDAQLINWSQPSSLLRVRISLGVAYGSDLELVKNCLLEVAKKHPMVRKYPEPMARFDKFGDNSLVFELIYWVDDAYARWVTLSELNFAIHKTFREHNITVPYGITIPFPQQEPKLPQEKKESKDTEK